MLPLAAKHNVALLPADSEHSAIFQCIQGLPEDGLRRIILTASGGHARWGRLSPSVMLLQHLLSSSTMDLPALPAQSCPLSLQQKNAV